MKNASCSSPLLQWTFHRAGRYVVCQVCQAGGTFTLSLQSLSPDSVPHVTTYASGVQAMQRHAEIALLLRAAGWSVVAYTASRVAGAQSAAA